MELVSEMIALDDEAKKLVSDAKARAESLKDKAREQIADIKAENERKLASLKEESEEKIESAKQEAAKKGSRYEAEKRAELDEYFTAHSDEMAQKIVNDIYSLK